MDLHAWITQQVERVEQLIGENEWPPSQAEGVRLRCEADRRILARHRLATEWGWVSRGDAPCHGCGTYNDCDDPVTDQLNECPELLDLAHAHGVTPEIFAGLDQPQPPKQVASLPADATYELRITSRPTPPITTSDVPEALRGPTWKRSGDG